MPVPNPLKTYPFLRFAFWLALGIAAAGAGVCLPFNYGLCFCMGCGVMAVAFAMAGHFIKRDWVYLYAGGVAALFLFLCGNILHTPAKGKVSQVAAAPNIRAYTAVICQPVVYGPKYARAVAETRLCYTGNARYALTQKVVLTLPANKALNYGDVVMVAGHPRLVEAPKNPLEFDYQKWLAHRGITLQHFVTRFNVLGNEPPSVLRQWAVSASGWLHSVIYGAVSERNAASLMVALVTGERAAFDAELVQAYANAGVTHLIAVSGAQVLLLYQGLSLLLLPLKRRRSLFLVSQFAVLVVLWFYAFVAGLSPSVVRAVVMFSFIIIGDLWQKRPVPLNNLCLAAFVMMLANPAVIFDVGFQLSFAAVAGLILLATPLQSIWKPSSKVVRYFWAITCTTLAAQIATAPLTVYYFNQFPNYFLVTNLLLIPLSAVILFGALLLLLLAPVPLFGHWYAQVLQGMVQLFNGIIKLTASLPGALANYLSLSGLEVVLLYLLTAFIAAMVYYRRPQYAKWALGISMLFTASVITGFTFSSNGLYIVAYNIDKAHALMLYNGGQATAYTNIKSLRDAARQLKYSTYKHQLVQGVETLPKIEQFKPQIHILGKDTLQISTLTVNNKLLVFTEGKCLESIPVRQPLRCYAVFPNRYTTLHALRKLYKPEVFVLDGSLSPARALKMEHDAEELGLTVWNCHRKGVWQVGLRKGVQFN